DLPLALEEPAGPASHTTFASATAETAESDAGLDLDLALDFTVDGDSIPAAEAAATGDAAQIADDSVPEAAETAATEFGTADDAALEPVRFSSFGSDDDGGAPAEAALDDDVAALAAQLEAFEAADQRESAREPDFTQHAAVAEPAPT